MCLRLIAETDARSLAIAIFLVTLGRCGILHRVPVVGKVYPVRLLSYIFHSRYSQSGY